MAELVSTPIFGVALSIAAFQIGRSINDRWKSPLLNPLLIAIVLCIAFLRLMGISYEDYNRGGSLLSLFLAPATVSLSLSIYRQRQVLRRSFLPVMAGCVAGAATSLVSVTLLSRLLGFDESLTVSLLPKSVTTPIALELSAAMGGVPAITTVAVVVTGITGGVAAPLMVRLFRVKNPVAAGIGIGASSHAIGTSKAVELGEVQGAMSGIAIGLSGLLTVLLYLVFFPG